MPTITLVKNNSSAFCNSNGEIDASIELYSKALNEAPDDLNILSDRGVAYLHKEDKLRCFGDLNRAIQLQPDYAYRYAARAFAKKHFGDLDGAVEDYENDSSHPERDVHGQVYFGPVGGDRSKPPGTEKMKKNGDDDQ